MVSYAQFGIGIYGCPGPNIAPSLLLLFGCDILFLRSDKAPNLIALETLDRQIAHRAMVEVGTSAAHFAKQFDHGVLCRSGDPDRATNALAFTKALDNLRSLGCRKLF